jgi:cytochrome P450
MLADLAEPLQNQVFLTLIGLPLDQADRFLNWKRGLMQAGDGERRAAAGADLTGFLTEQLNARQGKPAPAERDVIGILLESRVDGRPLSHDEALDTLVLLFMAGLDTLVTVAGFSFRFLAENPDHRRRLAASPALAADAAEELLRVHSIASVSRTATCDTELCGVKIRRGDRVLASTALANRDPREFEAATAVRFDRPANRHIAYGAGPHRCIGSHLASRELTIILEEFHRRIPEYQLLNGYQIQTGGGAVASIDAVPLVWDAFVSDESGETVR